MRRIEFEVEPFSMVRRNSVDGIHLRVVDGTVVPALCVKVPPLYDRLPEDVRGKDLDGSIFNEIVRRWWESIPRYWADACLKAAFRGLSTRADGRSDGWLVVLGLGDPRAWSQRKRVAWFRFERMIRKSMREAESDYVEAVREIVREPVGNS